LFPDEIQALTDSVRRSMDQLGVPAPESVEWLPTPFHGEWAIGTAACYQAAAQEAGRTRSANIAHRAEEIARAVAESLTPPFGFSRIRAEKAYLNAYFDTATYARKVVDTILAQGADYGRGSPKAERVMVEYAQPNTLHSFHIGHLRNTVLGESLARLVEFAGFETIRASYPGDIGLGVMTCNWAYQKFYRGQEPAGVHDRGRWLAQIYTEANAMLTPRPGETPEDAARRAAYEAEVREMYRRWDAGDPEVRRLWELTRQWSLEELQEVLRMLNARIDVFFFESEADEPAKEIVEELVRKGIAEDERASGNPVIVKIDEQLGLKKDKYRTAVLLRSDGTTLYLAKDLALARLKFDRYRVDRSIYVVDVRQSLHLQQAFKILELWGFPQAARCYHLAYGTVTLPEGSMSSRKGNVVYFKDVADEAERRILGIIAEKNPDLPQPLRQEVARKVGLGAVIYAMLAVDNTKDIQFEWERALSFEGQSAPYIQNAHVRANSILRKGGELPPTGEFRHSLEPFEVELIDLLSRFPVAARQAAEQYKPLIMATYAYELGKAFHAFYHEVPVLQTEQAPAREARVRLVAAARQVLASSLRLLDIQAPEVM
jgi:arginyl-tRNA synthetase